MTFVCICSLQRLQPTSAISNTLSTFFQDTNHFTIIALFFDKNYFVIFLAVSDYPLFSISLIFI